MTTIITRSALIAWGHRPASNVASIVDGRVVTWQEVIANRRDWQRKRLQEIHSSGVITWRPCKLWVAYFDQRLMGGWHAFLEDRTWRTWVDRDARSMKSRIMELFPLILPFDDEYEQWHAWKVAFAKAYRKRMQCKKAVGVRYVWQSDRGELRHSRPHASVEPSP